MKNRKKRKMGRFLSLLMAGMITVTSIPMPAGAEEILIEETVIAETDDAMTEAAGAETIESELTVVPEESVESETTADEAETVQSDTETEQSSTEAVQGDAETVEEELLETETDIVGTQGLELETDGFIEEIVLVEEAPQNESELLAENREPGIYTINTAADVPTAIYEGQTYELAADVTLASGQQIASIAGVLDGKGHVVTLADKPLAKDVTGTIQNLGLAGSITLKEAHGSFCASLSGGTLRNSYSVVNIAYDASYYGEVGGLAGTAKNAAIRNCYFAGEITGSFYPLPGGLTEYAESGNTFANCYYTPERITGMGSAGSGYIESACARKTADEFKNGEVTDLLNTGMTPTGYHFISVEGSFPVLAAGDPETPEGTVSWADLEIALQKAEGLSKQEYTQESWEVLAKAVEAGRKLKTEGTKDQAAIDDAAKAIETAIKELQKRDPFKPTPVPEDAVKISSQADFAGINDSAGKYYVLTQDITIDKTYASAVSFSGILDGQGHTITFDGGANLFYAVEKGAIIQNMNLTGEVANARDRESAPFGSSLKGSILNCRSEVSGTYVSGFVQTLGAGGVIANSVFVGDTGNGAFYRVNGGGELRNSYAVGINSDEEMTSKELTEKLNAERGEHGTQWGQGTDGYPYFGPDQEYDGSVSWPELPQTENKYPIAFTEKNTSQKTVLSDRRLALSPEHTDGFRRAGEFSLEGYAAPAGTHIEWELTYARPSANFGRDMDTGMLFVYGTGKAVIEARQVNADGSSSFLAAAAILSTQQKMTDIRLLIDGQDVTNGQFTIQGSEQKSIQVQGKYAGQETWNNVSYFNFEYTADEAGKEYLYNYADSYSTFYFTKPGTATITVTHKNQPELSKNVTVTSEYVPVESVRPANPESAVLHARNANSDGQEADGRVAYNPIHGNAMVTPVNASNADKVEITSNNETIAYFTGGEKAFVPKQAGKVTFTAKIEDTNPTTGQTRTVTGSADTVFSYLNPVVSADIAEELQNQTVAAGEVTPEFMVNVTGSRSGEGYDVTEPALKWTYSVNGIAQVVRKGTGYWKKDAQYEGAPDYGNYLCKASYEIRGLSEGTVVATGTPIDETNQVEPITITITVTKGSGETTDMDQLAGTGAEGALGYIENTHKDKGYAYGNEWLIYGMLQGGKQVEGSVLDAYYQSAAQEAASWTQNQKPTDIARTMLALTRMGKDVTNVNGVNLAAMLYNHPSLDAGSNEMTYALIALDAADITIPAGAKWTRDKMITALLAFQSADGGFGLYDSSSSGVDTTAMALQGLTNYRKRPAVQSAIERALAYLRGQMGEDFGYGTSEATAQVLLALVGLGIDPTSPESGFGSANFNLVTNLMKYQKSDGGFSHLVTIDKSVEMSTVQALQALDAYRNRAKGSYWNINGVKAAVTFAMYGDSVHDSEKDGHIHTFAGGNLEKWIADTEYRISDGNTVADVIDAALTAHGMTCKKTNGGAYIASVTRNGVQIGEFTNGRKSGWMYTLNGVHSELAITEQTLKDGDVIVFHYTDDFTKEKGEIKPEQPDTEQPHTHTWDTGRITEAATCTKDGVKTYTCTVCGETKTEAVKATGHKFGSWTKTEDATVFAPEKQARTCSVCKVLEKRESGAALQPTIKVTANKITLKIKQSTKGFKVTGLAAGDYVKSYKSSNTKIFKVSKNGKITAGKKTGKAKLTITLASGLKKKVTVKVQKADVKTTKITGLDKTLKLKKGKKTTLEPTLKPFTSKQKITYTSSNKKIVTVNAKGVVKAVKPGKAKITVKSGNKQFVVTVKVTTK